MVYFEKYSSLRGIKDEWDSFLPEDHPLRSREIEFLENCNIDDIRFLYVIMRTEHTREIEALAYFQLIHFKNYHYSALSGKTFLLTGMEKALMKKGFHILCCGNSMRVDAPGLFFKDERKIPAVFSSLEKFYQSLREKIHVVWIKDWQDDWSPAHFKQFSFGEWGNDMSMKLNIPAVWHSMDDYANSLRHHYAQRFRKARKMKKNLVVREFSVEDTQRYGDEIFALYKNVVDRQPIRMVIADRNYFPELKKNYGDNCMLVAYTLAGKLVGFSSIILKKNFEELHLIGIDYSINEKTWLYFNIMFDALEYGIQHKMQWMELGRTARQPKAAMGAHPVYFKNYIRINHVLIRGIVSLLKTMFNKKMSQSWEGIQAFKTSQAVNQLAMEQR